jgi:ATP-dependent exoDNAse (exonuclease V) alpha subunit
MEFLEDEEQNTFILKGYAGTGKTFLMQELAKLLSADKKPFSFLATTGRAATVLKGKTGFDAKTIHGELYQFHEVDGDSDSIPNNADVGAYGQMLLVFNLRAKDQVKKLYIVDEASMVSTEIIVDNSYAKFGTGNLLEDLLNVVEDNKIIFVGDPCQLPPIEQSFSPALDEEFLTEIGRKVKTGNLEEIVRTKADNEILKLAGEVRGMIGKEATVKWPKVPAIGKSNCIIHPSEEGMLSMYLDLLVKREKGDIIAVAQSNGICNKINESVRRYLYNLEHAPLQVGDVLMVTQNNYLVPLTNGDFVEVLSIGEQKHQARFHFQNIRVKHQLTGKEHDILLLLDILYGTSPNLNKEQQRLLMIDFSQRMREKGITANSKRYKDKMQEDPYLNSLRATFGYAVTCHKAQGGEWSDVFLFLQKGMYAMDRNDMFRWWYTAITRSKERLHLATNWWII